MSFADELRQANAMHKQSEADKQQMKLEAKTLKDKADLAWAKTELESVKSKALLAAKEGKTRYIIAELDWTYSTYDEYANSDVYVPYDGRNNTDKVNLTHLKGKYAHLASLCLKVFPKVELVYDYDGGGMRCWYNLIVSW